MAILRKAIQCKHIKVFEIAVKYYLVKRNLKYH